MKKIITLLFSLGALTSVFAQNTRDMEDAKRVILGAPRKSTPTQNPKDVVLGGDNRRVYGGNDYPETYPNGSSSRNVEINNINRDYDAKIYSIQNNRYLSAAEKERMIRQLEGDRARAIRNVNNRYGNNKGYKNYGDRDDDYKKNKKNKGNNGNHYGWEKGKGNPHKGKY
jgi:hypothetical protein